MQVVKDFCSSVVGKIGFDDGKYFLVEREKQMHRRLDNDAYWGREPQANDQHMYGKSEHRTMVIVLLQTY